MKIVWEDITIWMRRTFPHFRDKGAFGIQAAGEKVVSEFGESRNAFLASEERYETHEATLMADLKSHVVGDTFHVQLHVVVATCVCNQPIALLIECCGVGHRGILRLMELILPQSHLRKSLHKRRSGATRSRRRT